MNIPLPEMLIASLRGVAGFDEAAFRAVHDAPDGVTAVRLNPAKHPAAIADFPRGTEGRIPPSGPVPWTTGGLYLPERPPFYLDPRWHAGAYYVQDASSMSLEFALRHYGVASGSLRVLDLCASPGGKSTLISGLLGENGMLVSNEIIHSRQPALEENLTKWASPSVVLTRSDAAALGQLQGYFDVIVVDAPCSGSGLFRKDPDAISQWSPEQVLLCAARQRRILSDIMPALKEGGLLIYCTCSFSAEENEQISDYLLEDFNLESLPVPFDPRWGIVETVSLEKQARGYRFYPYRLQGEGFYLACFRNLAATPPQISARKGKPLWPRATAREREAIQPWIREDEGKIFIQERGQVQGISALVAESLPVLQANARVRAAGVLLGRLAGEQLIPAHGLAMSDWVAEDISRLALEPSEALAYLRKQELSHESYPPGWQLVCLGPWSLGWLKGMGRRMNNYYPTAWRLRS
jgi:16S rRNA C967 or C1407 C5-methylase (RsmB/RsmF family)